MSAKYNETNGQEMIEINGHTNEVNAQNNEAKGRGQWSKGIEFLLSCISMSVGLGNVWRFPHAAYTNGGGAFLIPYLILLFIIGRPMYYMELVLGQFSGKGPIRVWKCVPAFKGIGFAQMFSTVYIIIFYNYLMALTLYYLFSSFSNPLPWSVCDPEWVPGGICPNETIVSNITTTMSPTMGPTISPLPDIRFLGDEEDPIVSRSWSELYYTYHVLNKSGSLGEMTWISWKLVLCLLGSWTLVYLSIIKGIGSLGKVAYFTAIFPYTVLIALLGIALSTDGALDGIKFFFTPVWSKLLEPMVWYRAVEQSFFSLAVCFGTLVMFSSYNEFHNNVYRDAIIIAVLDTFTSLLAGCVIFSVLGHLSKTTNRPIETVVEGGLGLAFVAYPEALSKIQVVPQLWSVLFFIMLFTLGIGSSVAQVETILTSIKDEFTSLRQKKEILALIACLIFFVLGLPLTTDAGTYVMSLLDNYGVGTAVFFYGICQTVAVFWVYGLKRFCSDVKFMLNKSVGIFWKVTWGFASPIALIVIFIYGNIEIIGNSDSSEKTGIPSWGTGIGWALAAIAIVQIPLWMVLTVFTQKGSLKEKIVGAFRPSPDWGPNNPKVFQEWVDYNNEKLKHSLGYINTAFTSDNIKAINVIKI